MSFTFLFNSHPEHLTLLFRLYFTSALAVLHVRLQFPALVTRAFHTELVLLTALTALKVFGTETLDLTGLVVGPQLHAQWTGTDHTLARGHCAVMAAFAILQ